MNTCLNPVPLTQLGPEQFLAQKPFPWITIPGFLDEKLFKDLCRTMPDVSQLTREFGKTRGYGQESHDRWSLQYRDGLPLSPAWQAFIDSLKSKEYERFIRRLFGLKPHEQIVFTMHWHYAGTGCSVSPHVDASRKLGSHIFYFHTDEDWDNTWGGQTVVLDDGGTMPRHSAPAFNRFKEIASSTITNNHSFIFKRTEHSWHGVKPLTCPENRLRKVFIVVINRVTPQVLWRMLRGKDADGHKLR
jgi:hypothetical protein